MMSPVGKNTNQSNDANCCVDIKSHSFSESDCTNECMTAHSLQESNDAVDNEFLSLQETGYTNEFIDHEHPSTQGFEKSANDHIITEKSEIVNEDLSAQDICEQATTVQEQRGHETEETETKSAEMFFSTQEKEETDKSETFESQCELCGLGYNGTVKDHLNVLFDNLIGPQRFQQMYRAMQKHWTDFNMRNAWVQPFCKICNIHFQGFLKMGVHLGEKSSQSDDTNDKTSHLALLDNYRAFMQGIRDDSVSRAEQEELLKLLTCDHGPSQFHKLQLKGSDVHTKSSKKEETEDTVANDGSSSVAKNEEDQSMIEVAESSARQQNSDVVGESDGSNASSESQAQPSTANTSAVQRRHESHQPLFRCLVCHRDFRYLRAHIFESFWNVASEQDSWNNGFSYHMRGLLGNSFNELLCADDKSKHTPWCPCCGAHFCTSKGFSKGLVHHLRTKGYAWQKPCAEREAHRAKCDEIIDQIMSYLDKNTTLDELVLYFEQNFFCRLGGADADLGSCCDASRRDLLIDEEHHFPNQRSAQKRRVSEASGGARGAYFHKMARVLPITGGANASVFGGRAHSAVSAPVSATRPVANINMLIQCSLCSSQFNGCAHLHAHLMETLFAARIGRGGLAFPTHRYWHQLLPNSLPVSCPLCFMACDNLDALAFHIASIMTNDGQHYQLACTIAEKFVSHMNGYLTMEDMSSFMDSMVKGGTSTRGRGAAARGHWGGNYGGRRGAYRGARR